VVNYARSSTAAEELVAQIEADGGSAIALQADVSKADEVDALISTVLDKIGRIDILGQQRWHYPRYPAAAHET
jgi:3-oxoacyl-[acyl-carrier protein] reductase